MHGKGQRTPWKAQRWNLERCAERWRGTIMLIHDDAKVADERGHDAGALRAWMLTMLY